MSARFSRRDFLKLAAGLPLLPVAASFPALAAQTDRPNVIVLLYDALCAFHLNTYGYARNTSPNFERFAGMSTVYHNHHSVGNFTTPSTASLFTGAYPWTHRAFNLNALVVPTVRLHNLFQLLSGTYHQSAFTQNIYADTLLYQFEQYLEQHPALDSFSQAGHIFYSHLFPNDAIYGMKGYDQLLFKREEAHGSLLLSLINDIWTHAGQLLQSEHAADLYPDGLPRLANTDVYFSLSDITGGMQTLLDNLPPASFAYLHLMPPHAPYVPARPFLKLFDDDWAPTPKKKHRLAAGVPEERLNKLRRSYDQFIANLDDEFGRLLDRMEGSGLLENSYVILTSDHGEIFERGASGHSMPLLFEPNLRVPLLVHAPGQRQRQEVHALTGNVDLLPTLLALNGLEIPTWAEGQVLPGMGGTEDPDRSLYVVEAKANPAQAPLTKASTALLRGNLKLVHYLGYKHYDDQYELYDLQADPEELKNLYLDHPQSQELRTQLEMARRAADAPYT